MERLILFLLILGIFSGSEVSAQTESVPVPRETAVDLLPFGDAVPILHPGAFGTGAYPYRNALPQIPRDVRVDGVPLPSYSPFGADLEQIPALFADSLNIDFRGDIRIASIDIIPEKPMTRVAFTSGERRRNHFQGSFHRKVTDNSAIFIGGSSDGIRGNERIQGNGSRLYSVKYRYALKKGGALDIGTSGGRDRLNLPDILSNQPMGKRSIDHTSLAVGLDHYPVSSRTSLNTTAYYRNGVTRYEHYAAGSRYDDDRLGFSAGLDTHRGQSRYTLSAHIDTRQLDGQDADPDWDDTTAGLRGAGSWRLGGGTMTVGGGARWSEEYGAGFELDGDITVPVGERTGWVLRGSAGQGFPDAGMVIYPSLTYRDTVSAASLDQYQFVEAETGIVRLWNRMSAGMFGFAALTDAPWFDADTATMRMTDTERYAGGRLTFNISGERAVAYQADALVEYIGSTAMRSIWPRPMMRADTRIKVSRYYFRRNLHATAYGRARLEHRAQSPSPPDGTCFFLDLGLAFQVGTVSLFYEIENMTDTNQIWFGNYETQGRNSLWGVRWNLRN